MSVTAKTLGVVLVGLVGLLVYVGVYVSGATGIVTVATIASYIGLFLTATMLLVVIALCMGRTD